MTKNIELNANGYNFLISIDDENYFGEIACSMPLDMLKASITRSLESLNVNPDNVAEMNKGASWFYAQIVS